MKSFLQTILCLLVFVSCNSSQKSDSQVEEESETKKVLDLDQNIGHLILDLENQNGLGDNSPEKRWLDDLIEDAGKILPEDRPLSRNDAMAFLISFSNILKMEVELESTYQSGFTYCLRYKIEGGVERRVSHIKLLNKYFPSSISTIINDNVQISEKDLYDFNNCLTKTLDLCFFTY